MSEYINNRTQRQETLKRLIRDLHAGKSVEEVKAKFASLLQDVGATELAEIEQALISEGLPETEIKRLCDVHVAVFRDSLEAQASPETIPGHPVHTFRQENEAAARVLNELTQAIEAVQVSPDADKLHVAAERLEAMRAYEAHYLRKENILFPYLERHGFTGPSSVMWAIHDDIRAGWQALATLLERGPADDPSAFVAEASHTFEPLRTAISEMFYKEEHILFPAALERLDAAEWQAIRAQEPEIGYAYVEPGTEYAAAAPAAEPPAPALTPEEQPTESSMLSLDVGALTLQQISLLLAHLPVDVTYVDADDRVRFFSRSRERIFQRSPAIIGRKVQQCHPPASVHRVQRILDDFRAGRRDTAEFWIQMSIEGQPRFIHIRYFALRDDKGAYQGTLEVSQDVTDIRRLHGERRLLDEGA